MNILLVIFASVMATLIFIGMYAGFLMFIENKIEEFKKEIKAIIEKKPVQEINIKE